MANVESRNKNTLDIAIIGSGIVGLVLSLGLVRRDVYVKVYEQASSLREIGLGVAFSANAIKCMRRIHPDVEAALRAVATPNGGADDPNNLLRFVDGYNQVSDTEPHQQRPLFDMDMGKGAFEGCHRAHLLAELAKRMPEGSLVFGKRLSALQTNGPEGRIKLHFEDGTTTQADSVIGCDGIKSRVRRIILGADNPASYPTYSDHVCYRALIPMDRAVAVLGKDIARNNYVHCGPKAHVVHFPVAEQTAVSVAAFAIDTSRHWSSKDDFIEPTTRKEVQAVFSHFGKTVRDIINLLPEELVKWAIFDSYEFPVPFYSSGVVCIAGDAAHAAAPHHGAGAGIGVEDSLCISTLLDLVSKAVVEGKHNKYEALVAAFKVYDAVRKPRCHWLVDSSHNICGLYEWQDPEIGDDPLKCRKELEWRSHKIWFFNIDGMLTEASKMFEEGLKSVIKNDG
ncbi:hypothetical protein N0V90_012013 [Kalmusia sp. IMI 367209]|nr:hypothetical protein N0V90_012013 [Kalmusia sp. IMI 367209]